MQLNHEQSQAVSHFDGTCIVTAVPGSGKTRVLTSRVVHLIKNHNIDPRNILCLTFTNKAANEMKERVVSMLSDGSNIQSQSVWMSTFHRLCLAILRKHGHLIGVSPDFIIYASKEQEDLIAKVARMNGYEGISRDDIKKLAKAVNDFREDMISLKEGCQELNTLEAQIVVEYLEQLDKINAVDFSGMLYKTWILLNEHSNVAESLANRFKYVLVDEMQDTNRIQYDLVKRIAAHQNLFVVGDIQQSIFSWRGAKPENLDDLKSDFDDVREIILPRNYRSTTQILSMAESLIRNNNNASSVELISDKGDGIHPYIVNCSNPEEEANHVAELIAKAKHQHGFKWKDCAVLYRLNSMSRSVEMALRSQDIPYRIVGGFSFFDRKEVKTVLAYLSLLTNDCDTVSFNRAVQDPKRGIGDSLVGKLERQAQESDISILDACGFVDNIPNVNSKYKRNLLEFVKMMRRYKDKMDNGESLSKVVSGIIQSSGYYNALEKQAESDHKSDQSRIDNVDELVSSIEEFEEQNPTGNLGDYLQSVQLMSELKEEEKDDVVTLLTMHSAKGLEWPCVFIVGVEEGSVPHYRSVQEGSIEEERRLMYVAITRAEKLLHMSHCTVRRNKYIRRSQFLDEISY